MGTPRPTTSCHGDIGDIMAMGTPRPRALCYDGDTAPPWGRHGHGDVTARSSALWGHHSCHGDIGNLGTSRPGTLRYGDGDIGTTPWGHLGAKTPVPQP